MGEAKHNKENARNALQSDGRVLDLCLGIASFAYIISIVRARDVNSKSTLRSKDVLRVDKQDDGAAFRTFHSGMMQDCISAGNTELGVYLFVLGQLFNATLSRHIGHHDRMRMAFTAFSFLLSWKAYVSALAAQGYQMATPGRNSLAPQIFKLMLRQCRSIVLLIMAHAKYSPETPLCTWLHSTEMVEHLFGIARSICPEFSLLEFQHVMPRIQRMQSVEIAGDVRGINAFMVEMWAMSSTTSIRSSTTTFCKNSTSILKR